MRKLPQKRWTDPFFYGKLVFIIGKNAKKTCKNLKNDK